MADNKQQSRRLIDPDGGPRVRRTGLAYHPLRDLYHFLLVARWPVLVGLLFSLYIVGNAVFACAFLLQP
ncbi:MAG: hypothetical protein O2923_08005 [Verrucomicrobia bacterium]|nr:hypothetical protein [Verrucomicrobiota bacterium]